jgi:hypothetical protein
MPASATPTKMISKKKINGGPMALFGTELRSARRFIVFELLKVAQPSAVSKWRPAC